MLYEDQSYLTLQLDTGINLSEATEVKILYQKPGNGTKGEWPATASGPVISYHLVDGDIDVDGIWKVQAYAVIDGKKAFGDIKLIHFQNNIKA